MSDQNFPYIVYNSKETYRQWGQQHGESYKLGIQELVQIRTELMLQKNPQLKGNLKELAQLQFEHSKKFASEITDELEGIAEAADLPISDIVILNNYTDFRDLQLPEEGCSTIHIQADNHVLAGQTWDMHGSAKNYVSVINVPPHKNHPGALLFSLVGCVGMMGINTHLNLVGVNNINTANAKAGIKWPVLIRKLLQQNGLAPMRKILKSAPVTSGHNYLISSPEGGEHWEVTPGVDEKVSSLPHKKEGAIFHTNHCLGAKTRPLEDHSSLSSTTYQRYNLLHKKVAKVRNFDDLAKLLTDHEEYPKSICSHFESNAQDPSQTCGGAIADLTQAKFYFWRGCPEYDKNFVDYHFTIDELDGDKFFKLKEHS